ncbi:MAG: hypothetical protein E6J90_35005, partial [Deltaproteobacteria bacterium]
MRIHHALLGITLAATGATTSCGSSSQTPTAIATAPSPAPPPSPAPAAACVTAQDRPPPVVPWSSVEALCAAPHGTPWAPPSFRDPDKAALDVQRFLRDQTYRQLGWLHDADWRLTGPFDGCPCPPGSAADCKPGVNRGPHPAVRIYYSPEAIDWMCKYRRDKDELPNAAAMPDGAMVIKEMMSPAAMQLALVPGSRTLWIAPVADKPVDYYDQAYDSWTVLLKDREQSADGWYWAFFDKPSPANPPIWDRCAFTRKPYPGMDGAPVTAPPGCQWLPTYWKYDVPDQQYPNAQFGNYCVYCHASAQGQLTFVSFDNLMGTEIEYPWGRSAAAGVEADAHSHALLRRAHARDAAGQAAVPGIHRAAAAADRCPASPFPSPEADPLPGWNATFPELDPSYSEI